MEILPNDLLANELQRMYRLDQEMRFRAQTDPSAWDDSIDLQNTARLRQIVEQAALSKITIALIQQCDLLKYTNTNKKPKPVLRNIIMT